MTERTSADQDTAPVQLGDQKNIGWNFAVNLWDIMFITLGLSLVSRDTVMPVLVSNLTDSKLAIGMIPALVTLGYYLPQLLSANISERMTYKKPFVATIGFFGERLPYLLIAVSLYFLAVDAPLASLFIFFLCIGVASSSAGFGTPAWFDMIAKVIPVERRGIWSGLGHGLGAVISVAALYLVALPIMQRTAYPANFALLFTLAFVAMAVSWVGLVLTREPPTQIVKASMASIVYFRQLPSFLRRDANYRRFLISRSTVQLATMASAFYIVYGTDAFSIDASGVVALTIVSVSAVAVMNLVWGVVGDRRGHKLVLTLAAFCLSLAAIVALAAPSPYALGMTFVFLGAYMAADQVSGLNIILEFCAPEDRPTYIGLTNTLLAPVVTLAPLLGALLASALGYRPMFAVAMTVSAAGGLLLLRSVREPRHTVAISGIDDSQAEPIVPWPGPQAQSRVAMTQQQPLDDLARFNKARWEDLAQAGVDYSRPRFDLNPESAIRMLDPDGVMGDVSTLDVLCLASGGGQQSVAFALLGSQVTVFDLSDTQLERDRAAAKHYGISTETVQGDMRDLGCFDDDSFDIVYQAFSLNFVPDVRPVHAEVARVLTARRTLPP